MSWDTMCLPSSPHGSMHMGSQEVVLGQLGSLSSQLFMKELMLHVAWEVMWGAPGRQCWVGFFVSTQWCSGEGRGQWLGSGEERGCGNTRPNLG